MAILRQFAPLSRNTAFTRSDLVAVLGAITLVALVVLPALANSRPRAQRLTCVSNLREIGQSLSSWSSEFGNRLPSQVPANEGGSYNHASGLQNSAWFQYALTSNHVRSPRIFVCPADKIKREAQDFSVFPTSGFLHPNLRDNALSYILGHPYAEGRPDVLAGDRHLTGFYSSSCYHWNPTRAIRRDGGTSIGWTAALHEGSGNVLLNDGRVEQLSSQGLQRRLFDGLLGGMGGDAGPEFHFVSP